MENENRWGSASSEDIKQAVSASVPKNTIKTKSYIWKQFTEFCEARKYELYATATTDHLNNIRPMTQWAFNMKKQTGEDYEEGVIKTNNI
jgi:hypothetical protein